MLQHHRLKYQLDLCDRMNTTRVRRFYRRVSSYAASQEAERKAVRRCVCRCMDALVRIEMEERA